MLSVLNRVDGLAHNMKMEFEDTRHMLRFGLEAREALRETMEARFAEADRKHDQQIELLKDVLRGAR
jgi:putative heme iron utilization protein